MATKKKKKKKQKKNRRLLFLLIGLSLIVILACAYFFLSPLSIAERMLFHPVRPTVDSGKSVQQLIDAKVYSDIPDELLGAKREDVVIPVRTGQKLHGIYFDKPGAKYTFILHHGQGGNISKHMGLVKTVLLNGQSVLTYDYEGYGISSGTPSVYAITEDGRAAYDFLVRNKGVNPRQIIQYGASLGSGVASNCALTKGASAVVLIAPYTSLKTLAKQKLPYLNLYPDFLFPKPDLGSKQFFMLNKFIPVLIIHGDKDHTIDVSHSKDLKKDRKAHTKLVVISGKHHGDFSTEELAKELGLFISEKLDAGKEKNAEEQEGPKGESTEVLDGRKRENVNKPEEGRKETSKDSIVDKSVSSSKYTSSGNSNSSVSSSGSKDNGNSTNGSGSNNNNLSGPETAKTKKNILFNPAK